MVDTVCMGHKDRNLTALHIHAKQPLLIGLIAFLHIYIIIIIVYHKHLENAGASYIHAARNFII